MNVSINTKILVVSSGVNISRTENIVNVKINNKHVNILISRYGINGLSAYQIAVQNGFEGTEQEWLTSLSGNSGVATKTYRALCNQTSFQGNDLSVTVLENTLGTITWTTNTIGVFIGNIEGGFNQESTFVNPVFGGGKTPNWNPLVVTKTLHIENGQLVLKTYDVYGYPAYGTLINSPIEIISYEI